MNTNHTLACLSAAALTLSPLLASAQKKPSEATALETYTLNTKVDATTLLAKSDEAVDMGSVKVRGKTLRISCVASSTKRVQCRAYSGAGKRAKLLERSKVTSVDPTRGIVLDLGDGSSRVAIGGSILSSIGDLGGIYDAYPSSRWASSM